MQWKICYAETNHFCGYQDSPVNEFLNDIFDTARNTRLGVFAEPRIACWIFCHLKVTLRQASTNHVHKNEKRFERWLLVHFQAYRQSRLPSASQYYLPRNSVNTPYNLIFEISIREGRIRDGVIESSSTPQRIKFGCNSGSAPASPQTPQGIP